MAFRRRLFTVVLLIFFLVGFATPRTINTPKNPAIDSFHFQENVKDIELADELVTMERLVEGRMNMELTADYPWTGANNNHTPTPPSPRG